MYEDYAKVIPKRRGWVKITPNHIDSVEVQGELVLYSEIDINNVLGYTHLYSHDLIEVLEETNIDGIKGW